MCTRPYVCLCLCPCVGTCHSLRTPAAAAVKDSLKLAASVECSAVGSDGVEAVFTRAAKAVWDRDAKLVRPPTYSILYSCALLSLTLCA